MYGHGTPVKPPGVQKVTKYHIVIAVSQKNEIYFTKLNLTLKNLGEC